MKPKLTSGKELFEDRINYIFEKTGFECEGQEWESLTQEEKDLWNKKSENETKVN